VPYIAVPELDYHAFRILFDKILNDTPARLPSIINNTNSLHGDSFIDLLFSDTYSHNYYRYLFTPLNSGEWDFSLKVRLSPYGNAGYVYVSSETGSNIFQLQSIDLQMLDFLLEYKTTGFADTTSIIVYYDTTSFTAPSLVTNLSRLIYIDLVFMRDGITDIILLPDNALFPNQKSLLDSLYYDHILEKHFKLLSGVFDRTPPS